MSRFKMDLHRDFRDDEFCYQYLKASAEFHDWKFFRLSLIEILAVRSRKQEATMAKPVKKKLTTKKKTKSASKTRVKKVSK